MSMTENGQKVTIRRLRGILKRKPGERPLAQEMAAHKHAERELEDAKYARRTGSRTKSKSTG